MPPSLPSNLFTAAFPRRPYTRTAVAQRLALPCQALAESMGIETDWNCAISLRPLEDASRPDPHRMTSSYADWDVKVRALGVGSACMPGSRTRRVK